MRRLLRQSLIRMVACALPVALPAPLPAGGSAIAPDPWTVRARVVKVSDFPMATSGLIRIWISLTVDQDEDLKRLELLLLYLSRDQEVPRVAEHCIFQVHGERAGGFVGRGSVDTHDAIIVDTFRCSAKGN